MKTPPFGGQQAEGAAWGALSSPSRLKMKTPPSGGQQSRRRGVGVAFPLAAQPFSTRTGWPARQAFTASSALR
jgi:hypothetical protein